MSDDAWQVQSDRGCGALDALLDDWRRLQARCSTSTPFQSPEWLLPWWRCFSHGELRVVSVRRRGELQALVPLLAEGGPHGGRVTLLGTGNTDYLDALVADETHHAAAALAVAGVVRPLGPEDYCDFEQLSPASSLLTVPAPASWHWETSRCDVCPVLRLPPSEDQLRDVFHKRVLAKLRSARGRLERLGPVRIESATPENLSELLGAFFTLHRLRWGALGQPGVLADDTVRTFHSRVAEGFSTRGVLRLYALRVAEQITAVLYGFSWGTRTYCYLDGFDPAFALFSVGSLLTEHAIRESIREGAAEFDFLRGGEPHKYRWGAVDRASYRRVLRRDRRSAPMPSAPAEGTAREPPLTGRSGLS